MSHKTFFALLIFGWGTFLSTAQADKLLIYMDLEQADHLKAYGVAYKALELGYKVEWLLNYRGGSFMIPESPDIARICHLRGVAYTIVGGNQITQIYKEIEEKNMEDVLLEKAPSIAIYTPPNKEPWDDAVTLALTYAQMPYTTLWDEQVLAGKLEEYDWLHLHHEDFTGQYGKFYGSYRNALWYKKEVAINQEMAKRLGLSKVSELKKTVARAIKDYVARGGFLFSMCSATDAYDIGLAAAGVDIVDAPFDGDPPDPNCQARLDYSKTFAFTNFKLITNPLVYEFSDIDISPQNGYPARGPLQDSFSLFEFSAKYDPVPTMLTQDHVSIIKGFMGQTTAFRKDLIKKHVIIMGQGVANPNAVKYLHGNYGRGTFTYLGGHDPEDYTHYVYDPPTNLALYKNSPGYRLILNNVLFPAAKKKKRKT